MKNRVVKDYQNCPLRVGPASWARAQCGLTRVNCETPFWDSCPRIVRSQIACPVCGQENLQTHLFQDLTEGEFFCPVCQTGWTDLEEVIEAWSSHQTKGSVLIRALKNQPKVVRVQEACPKCLKQDRRYILLNYDTKLQAYFCDRCRSSWHDRDSLMKEWRFVSKTVEEFYKIGEASYAS